MLYMLFYMYVKPASKGLTHVLAHMEPAGKLPTSAMHFIEPTHRLKCF